MNRSDFQRLAATRLREAEALLTAVPPCPDGAYYLVGYAVECGLKACILARIEREGVIFDEGNKKFSESCWTHNLLALLGLAGLAPADKRHVAGDVTIDSNWRICLNWSEQARYQSNSETTARELHAAVADAQHGVLTWLTKHW